MSVIFVSCEKEETINTETNVENKGYVVENGYIRFKSIYSYDSIIKSLTTLNRNQLLNFKASLKYTTLYDIYRLDETPIDSINKRVEDVYLTILLNKEGVLMVGDTILKIVGDNAFLIKNADFGTLAKIDEGIDVKNYQNVKLSIHSNQLNVVDPNNQMMKLRGTETAYDNWLYTEYEDNKPVRYERVQFGAFCVVSPFWPFGLTYIGAKMTGEAKKKGFLGIWTSWFNDEIVSGSITINSGKWGPAGNCTNNVVTGGSVFNIPDKEFKIGLEYGPTNNLHAKDLNVTYKYIKTAGYSLQTKNIIWE